jgi:aryl-alcohol dehydrogenase-like predicted oxidoreductase
MNTRTLGRTGLSVSEIAYGAARTEPHDAFFATLDACLDAGINTIDTASGYGDSEELLGRHLEGRWEGLILSTKICPYATFNPRDPWTMTPAEVLPALEQSLRRLRRDSVEIVFAHGLRNRSDVDRWLRGGYFEALEKARDQGKVRFLGMSELSEADGAHTALRHAVPTGAFDVVMLTLNFMLQTAAETVLPLCAAGGTGTVIMMPLNQASPASGLVSVEAARNLVLKHLAAGHLPDDPLYHDPHLFDFLLQGPSRSLPEAALRFVLAHAEVDTACVGTRRPERLRENLQALEGAPPYLPAEQMERLRVLFGPIRWQLR